MISPGASEVPRLASCLFATQLLLALVLIPPWQNPDEPQHVMFASALAKHGTAMLPNAFDDEVERDIIQSMARHRWWYLYGRPTPSPLPPTFKGVQSVEMASIQGPASYYIAAASLLTVLRIDDVTSRMYVLRVVSAVLGMATLWCIWGGTRLLFGTTAAAVVAGLIATHPQFSIVSTTASPDAVVNLAGALIWWQLGRLWAGGSLVGFVVAVIAAAASAASVARLGLPLAVIGALVCVWAVAHRLPRRSMSWRGRTVAPLAIVAVAVGAVAWWFSDYATRILVYGVAPLRQALANAPRLPDPEGWLQALHASFWLTAGWMRFPAPATVTTVISGVAVFAGIGVILGWIRDRGVREQISVAVLCVGVQYAAVVATFYFNSIGAQGRYLFPVMGAVLSLGWVGVNRLIPRRAELAACTVLIAGAAVLNLVSWRSVLPNFLP